MLKVMGFTDWKFTKLNYSRDLFYVLGALMGDGCIYHWRNEHQIWLIGDKNFTEKYAQKLSKVIDKKVKNYINRSKNIWFVKISNIQLYSLFNEVRNNLECLTILLVRGDFQENALNFIEGFFDAEGCVKIIKEPVRKTPKICLDIANTNLEILEMIINFISKTLDINSKISKQIDKRKNRKIMYHLRIYKKESIKKFLNNIHTTKLKPEKLAYVENWLNNGK
jgi:hypothetical protein